MRSPNTNENLEQIEHTTPNKITDKNQGEEAKINITPNFSTAPNTDNKIYKEMHDQI